MKWTEAIYYVESSLATTQVCKSQYKIFFQQKQFCIKHSLSVPKPREKCCCYVKNNSFFFQCVSKD